MKWSAFLFLLFCGLFSFAQKDSCDAAFQYMQKKEYNACIKAANTCIAGTTDVEKLTLAYFNRYTAYEALGKIELAEFNINKVIELSPTIGNIRERASFYIRIKKYDEAFADYDKILKVMPNDYLEHFFKAKALYKAKKYTEAIELANYSITLNPKQNVSYTLLGEIYFEIKNNTKAREMLQKAIQIQNLYSETHVALGKINKSEGNFIEAVQNFTNANYLNPFDGNILLLRAESYAWLYRLDSAKTDLSNALKLKVNELEYNRVLIIIKAQGIPEINPETIQHADKKVQYHYIRALQLKKERRLSEAFQLVDDAIGMAPDVSELYALNTEILLTIIKIDYPEIFQEENYNFYDNEDWQLAMDDTNRAIQLDPKNAAAYYLRAEMYLIMKKKEKAKTDFQKCLKLLPQNSYYNKEITERLLRL